MSYYCDKGTLFGLTSKDLTVEQLAKVEFKKLVEFINEDDRVEQILCDKMKNIQLSQLSVLRHQNINGNRFIHLTRTYNDRIRSISDSEVKKDFGYSYVNRYDYIFWTLLDKENRIKEIDRWSKGESSVVRNENIDFAWLFANDREFANQITKNVISRTPDYDAEAIVSNLVQHLPKEEIENVIPTVKEKYSKRYKDAYLNILSNPNMPTKYIIDALRILSKKTRSPKIAIKIDEKMLRELPPITRLETLENIYRNFDRYRGHNPISGIGEDKIRSLLFSAVIKHPNRVEELIKGMKNRRLIA